MYVWTRCCAVSTLKQRHQGSSYWSLTSLPMSGGIITNWQEKSLEKCDKWYQLSAKSGHGPGQNLPVTARLPTLQPGFPSFLDLAWAWHRGRGESMSTQCPTDPDDTDHKQDPGTSLIFSVYPLRWPYPQPHHREIWKKNEMEIFFKKQTYSCFFFC